MGSHIEMTKQACEAFKRGDIAGLLKERIDDNCVWKSPGPTDKLPWAGVYKGKQEIGKFFMAVAQNTEFSEFSPLEMIEQGDTVVVLGRLAGRSVKTGKPVENEWAHVFKYKGDKVVSWQEYLDTAADVVSMT